MNNKKLCFVFSLFLYIFPAPLLGDTYSDITAFGTSAKTKALGNIEGIHRQASIVNENPASMQPLSGRHMSIFYTDQINQDTQFLSASIMDEYKDYRFGLSYTSLTIPDIYATSADENDEFFIDRSFQTYESVLTLAGSKMIDDVLSIGVSAKHFTQDLFTEKGSGFNIDVGLYYNSEKTQISALAKNIFTDLDVVYDSDSIHVDLPFITQLSIAREINPALTVYGQLRFNWTKSQLLKSVAAKWSVLPESKIFNVYFGFKESSVLDVIESRWTTGLGLELNTLEFQFFYEQTEYRFNPNQYGVSINIHI